VDGHRLRPVFDQALPAVGSRPKIPGPRAEWARVRATHLVNVDICDSFSDPTCVSQLAGYSEHAQRHICSSAACEFVEIPETPGHVRAVFERLTCPNA
jgi:hypothetical protein